MVAEFFEVVVGGCRWFQVVVPCFSNYVTKKWTANIPDCSKHTFQYFFVQG